MDLIILITFAISGGVPEPENKTDEEKIPPLQPPFWAAGKQTRRWEGVTGWKKAAGQLDPHPPLGKQDRQRAFLFGEGSYKKKNSWLLP